MTLLPIATQVPLSVPVPQPRSGGWFKDIIGLGSVEAVRRSLAERYPGLKAGRLPRMAIVGAADEGRRLIELCHQHDIEVVAICDDNLQKQNTKLHGHTVQPVDALLTLDRAVPVIIASHRPLTTVGRLRTMGFETIALFLALQILAPDRFPPHIFYDGIVDEIIKNQERYAELFEALADDTSRRHLDALLGFRVTADIGALAPVVDWDLYYPAGLFTLNKDEVYVDGGAFDGDSIRLFIQRVGGEFSRVIGFEPDPATYRTLCANFSDTRIDLINAGLHSSSKTLRFHNDGSRAATFTSEGGVEIPVVSLDDTLNGDRVTYVKMNIEGSELDALTGAQRSIAKWAPKLAISAYHRPSDLWQIPFHMRALNPAYRLYLRQQDAGIIETVAYAIAP